MSMTYDDYARDEALAELQFEAVMERAAREQAILLLVEGDSEEVALPILFTDVLEIGTIGLRIGNYNGYGNLLPFMKLLINTLEYPYPIIIAHDNDPASLQGIRQCEGWGLITSRVFLFPIPVAPVVSFSDGHRGGSFEESFAREVFISAAFSRGVLPEQLLGEEETFSHSFDPGKPWLAQLGAFCADRGLRDWSARKPFLARRLAEETSDLPETFLKLVSLIREVRNKTPVSHPNIVQLPKTPGLTS
jgi:hypothetical protein